ncbi:MAG: hypothetical protein FD159_456 [Syntrophaceae bacterium]|nr:MAG: hypothetical protein FD159_456 [Syntrophaceae bacterium]
MDTAKIDLIVKYILAAAGQDDFGNQELGPIHIVKYVYLADLAFAEAHEGETLTGAEWQFYHYGPWSPDVYSRIKTVVQDVNATERTITSYKYKSDFVRWRLQDDELYESLQSLLPFEVRHAIRDAVHEFGDDTTGLLHHVYTTWPMLHAAPLERLSFTRPQDQGTMDSKKEKSVEAPQTAALSKKEMKQRKEQLAILKERIKSRLAEKERNQKMVRPEPAPRYDDIFFDGVAWLDELAGAPILPSTGEIIFSDEIWKSRARSDEGIF